jgi:hypothetical protein
MDDAGVMDAVEAPVESPVEEGPSEIPPVESPETPEAAPTEAEEAPRGEVGNKEITQALKELRVSNPKVADALRKAYFAYGQFSNHFPNLRDAQAAKNALDTVGGPEGIATLREQVQSMQFVNQAAREGDSSY